MDIISSKIKIQLELLNDIIFGNKILWDNPLLFTIKQNELIVKYVLPILNSVDLKEVPVLDFLSLYFPKNIGTIINLFEENEIKKYISQLKSEHDQFQYIDVKNWNCTDFTIFNQLDICEICNTKTVLYSCGDEHDDDCEYEDVQDIMGCGKRVCDKCTSYSCATMTQLNGEEETFCNFGICYNCYSE